MTIDSETKARFNLPGEWLIGAVCPVCGHTKLSIERNPEHPDQMICKLCASSFEIAQDGELIRLCQYPNRSPSELANRWVKPSKIKEIAFRVQTENEQLSRQKVVDIPLRVQAIRLAKLGNPPQKIREILLRSTNAGPEEIDTVLVTASKEVKKEKKGNFIFWVMGAVIFALFVIIFIELQPGISRETKNNVAGGTQEDNSFNVSSLPGPLQTLIPKGVKVLAPDPVVVQKVDELSQPQVKCPQSPGEAAQLFGGAMESWSPGNMGGWVLVSFKTVDIYLPSNMSAGYLEVSGSPEMTTVLGPATIENVNFLAVSCQ